MLSRAEDGSSHDVGVRVAAVVMLYNPDPAFLAENIGSYVDQVDLVLAIDNSEIPVPATAEILGLMPKVSYIANGANRGVGYTLNLALAEAERLEYTHLFTLDQDSKATPGMIAKMLRCGRESGLPDIGILAARPVGPGDSSTQKLPGYEQVTVAITSGSLLDLRVCGRVGQFMEELFIDYVDFEYCLRLRTNGCNVVRVNGAELVHQVGRVAYHHLWGKTFSTTNHSPVRRYYMTRNRFYVIDRYGGCFPLFKKEQLRSFRYELLTVLLFEKQRLQKLRMIWRGYRDYRRGRLGRIDKSE